MPTARSSPVLTIEQAARFSPQQMVDLAGNLGARIDELSHQLEWFKRQLFGSKSEKRHLVDDGAQMSLGEALNVPLSVAQQGPAPAVPTKQIGAHTRKDPVRELDQPSHSFFDESRVPIESIPLPDPATAGLSAEQINECFERIGEKVSYRLAQRPGSFVVLKFVRPIHKARDTQIISAAAAPRGVIDGSRADVSFIVGVLIDKIAYHLPLYRQHQRLTDAGFKVSRAWLTQLMQQAATLLEPIYDAQFDSIRLSRVKAMDETPIKAGLAGVGKMRQAYFWPVYGQLDEVCFAYFDSRSHQHVQEALGLEAPPGAVMLSDGYPAYEAYTEKIGIEHARCWAHCRREFFEARAVQPQLAEQALQMIGALYKVEETIGKAKLKDAAKREYRVEHAKPIVDRFFAWVLDKLNDTGLLPSNPMTKALGYARNARHGLEVYLSDPDVAIDTNHLERALRAIPMGRRNWLFCWTELGAKHIGMMQSLIVTCRLHQVNPYDYLVDVLQRIGEHPKHQSSMLTPRLWKQHFADNPMRSDLYSIGTR